MPTLSIVLAAIQAVGAAEPAFVALIQDLKTLFGPSDQAAIDAALADADKQADAQHGEAQGL